MIKKIITRETFTNFTNINNNNNNNNFNDNNDNNTNDCVVLADSQTILVNESITPTASSGLAPLSASQPGEVISSVVGNPSQEIPKNCRGLKFDLFDNKPAFKLKASIIKIDGTTQELVAALNSPVDYIWRNVPAHELSTNHWDTVKQVETDLKRSGIAYKASKLSTPNKGSSTKMVVFVFQLNGYWNLFLVIKGVVYEYQLEEKLTEAQRKTNMIASLFVGKSQKKLLDWDDLV